VIEMDEDETVARLQINLQLMTCAIAERPILRTEGPFDLHSVNLHKVTW
jgi:hypothetical protein